MEPKCSQDVGIPRFSYRGAGVGRFDSSELAGHIHSRRGIYKERVRRWLYLISSGKGTLVDGGACALASDLPRGLFSQLARGAFLLLTEAPTAGALRPDAPRAPFSLGLPWLLFPGVFSALPLPQPGAPRSFPQDNGHRELQPAWSVALRSPAPGGQGTSSHHLENRRCVATWAT